LAGAEKISGPIYAKIPDTLKQIASIKAALR